jgi:hypothetical protein
MRTLNEELTVAVLGSNLPYSQSAWMLNKTQVLAYGEPMRPLPIGHNRALAAQSKK